MQISLVNGERRTAFTGGRGTCTICNSPTLAKCGPRIMHHWAHVSRRDCDLWWENETPWHREWKEMFSNGNNSCQRKELLVLMRRASSAVLPMRPVFFYGINIRISVMANQISAPSTRSFHQTLLV